MISNNFRGLTDVFDVVISEAQFRELTWYGGIVSHLY